MAAVDCFIMVFCALGFWYAYDSIMMTIEKDWKKFIFSLDNHFRTCYIISIENNNNTQGEIHA